MVGKLVVRQSSQWVDVSDKEIIIWGSGKGCFDMMNDLQMCVGGVYAVVDSNEPGTDILLMNKRYTVESPEILHKIAPDKCLIVISTLRYKEEIIRQIHEQFGTEYMICGGDEVSWCYERAEDMLLLDPIANQKMNNLHLTRNRYEIIKSVNETIKLCFRDIKIDKFISVRTGVSKLVFFFGNADRMWCYSIRGQWNTKFGVSMLFYNNTSALKRARFIKEHEIGNKITVYSSDDMGVLIQECGTEISAFGSEYIRAVCEECRRLHEMKDVEENLEENPFFERFYRSFRKRIYAADKISASLLQRLDEVASEEIAVLRKSGERRVIHGDLTCANIVLYNGEINFIDWEKLTVGNPMIDLGNFIYSVSCLNMKWGEGIGDTWGKCMDKMKEAVSYYCLSEDEYSGYIEPAIAVVNILFMSDILMAYLASVNTGIEKTREFLEVYKKHQKKPS